MVLQAMEEKHVQALPSLRERIRAVCVHDQAQWDSTWKEALSDPNFSRRGLILPNVFFEVLEANSVLLCRSDARLLLVKFQEPNGAVSATRFLRWMALSAPDDHVNPDLRFPQLPQPYRRVKKILENDIFDAAWDIITSESTRFKADNSTVDGLVSSSRSNRGTNKIRSNLQQQSNDYDVAKKRLCEPTWNIPLDNTAQQIAGLTSHCLLPLVVAGINRDPLNDSDEASVASLRVISTAENETTVLGDFPVEFPGDAQTPPSPDTITKVHVSIKRLSSLQLTNVESSNCRACIAVHLIETRTSEPANQEPSEDVQPAVPSIRECVSVYEVTQVLQHPSDDAVPERKISCRLLAMTNPTNGSLEPLISSIVLSPDSLFLAVTSVSSTVVQLYRLQREETSEAIEAGPQPVLLSSSTFQVNLEPTRSPFMQDECEPALYFLVAPVPTCVSNDELPRAAPITYAFAICYGLKVIKVLLPPTNSSNGAPSVVLNPVKTWEHLTKITASAQDITTQYLAVGCQDGTIVVWDVLQDADFAFLSPLNEVNSNQVERSSSRQKMPRAPTLSEISDVIFSHAGYVIALSKSQQRLYFFDVRERGNPMLKRVVSQPELASSTTTRQVSLQSGSSMVTVTASAATANAPIALIRYFNGMVMIYDVRTADAIGSFQTMSSMATSPKAHPVSSLTNIASNEMNTTMVSIVGNQHALSVAVNSVSSAEVGEACVKLYSWRNILLVCYPYLAAALEERNEEPTSSILKQLVLARDTDQNFAAAPPSTVTVPSASTDPLETMFLRMAGELPPSPSRAKQIPAGGLSSPHLPVGRNSMSIDPAGMSVRPSHFANDVFNIAGTNPGVMLEPLVRDDKTFFRQFCREFLDPAIIAEKEAKLHRKRRELLKTMSAGGAW